MISWKQLSLLSALFILPHSAEGLSDTKGQKLAGIELAMLRRFPLMKSSSKKCPPPKKCPPLKPCRPNSFKIRGAAFFPQGQLTKKIYGNTWAEGSLEYNYYWRRAFSVFVNGAATGKSGHGIGIKHSTSIVVVPVTIGVNGHFGSSWVHPYLGVGVGAAYAHITNHYRFVKERANKGGFASLYQAGIEFDCNSRVFIDLFADYRWNWFDFNKQSSRQTGGFDVGLGLGFQF
jgi:hypothetical protein